MNLTASNKFFNVIDHDVMFYNSKDDITLSGTLSIPEFAESYKKPPVVILVAGMGPHDRDCDQMNGQKLFVTIADYFTQRGIAVLRYDKRGVGKSGGNFNTAFTFDFARDVEAAIQFLKHDRSDIDIHNIGLVGHSEGGLISFIVASQSRDLAFMVSMAGAVITKIDDILLQTKLQFKASGGTDNFVAFDKKIRKQILEAVTTLSVEEAQKKLATMVKPYIETMTSEQSAHAETLLPFSLTEQNCDTTVFNTAWRIYLLSNPTNFISKVTIPVLAIHGELDFIMYSKVALPIIAQGLDRAGNKDVTIVSIPHQNHCFQQCSTGAINEYLTIKESINESTLKLMADWILFKVV